MTFKHRTLSSVLWMGRRRKRGRQSFVSCAVPTADANFVPGMESRRDNV